MASLTIAVHGCRQTASAAKAAEWRETWSGCDSDVHVVRGAGVTAVYTLSCAWSTDPAHGTQGEREDARQTAGTMRV